ncbi:MAG: hypothetical protein A2542_00090 [Parcubacteria group bacterium RIFOXYD2_FULL_52_8]|nr:MAG: hypothetical protein A2542_00090 [Parcubacteria group bacterium RIFOXYD2_FULL_52_8]
MPTRESLQKVILKYLGIDGLPEEDQKEIVEGLTENVLRGIVIAMLGQVPHEMHPEFRRLREAGDNEALTKFLRQYIPDLEALVQDETKRTVDEFRQVVMSIPTSSPLSPKHAGEVS